MTSKMSIACALMPALLAFGPAEAATYDLWQGASPMLSGGAIYTAAFDTRLLFERSTMRIDSATLTFNFIGAEQPVRGASTSVVTASSGGYSAYDYIDSYADSIDRALILLAGRSPDAAAATASSAFYTTDVVRSTRPVGYWNTSCYPITGCSSYYVQIGTDRFIDRVAGYKGAFSYVAQLDAGQLSQFTAEGFFRYGYTVDAGGVQLASAELVFSTSPVPEPHLATLMVAGLAVMAWLPRRRRVSSQARR